MNTMIPLMVDCTGKRIIIFGGGTVGARKARYFAGEADVTVYSQSFAPDFASVQAECISQDIQPIKELLCPLVEGAFLVITTTPDTNLNDLICECCRDKGILCNNASGEPGDVILPAKISGARYLVAISSFGSSPAISRLIRETIEESFPALDTMISLLDAVRPVLKGTIQDQPAREETMHRIIHDPVIWEAAGKSYDEGWQAITERYSL